MECRAAAIEQGDQTTGRQPQNIAKLVRQGCKVNGTILPWQDFRQEESVGISGP
jgi:hypothetical protein